MAGFANVDRPARAVSHRSWRASMRVVCTFLLCLAVAVISGPAQTDPQHARPELRAFWVDGFSDGFKSPEQVDELVQRVHAAHCNAVFAQMRKGGDAYYASHYEPWAKDDETHFDALSNLIAKAHAATPRIA